MTIALISRNPTSILRIFEEVPSQIDLPNGDKLEGAQIGWRSADGSLSIVTVVSFETPIGEINVGSPAYTFDDSGNVIETYSTQAAPAPEPPAVTAEQFLQFFTTSEREAIEASVDPSTRDFVTQLEAAGSFELSNTQIVQGVNYLVSQNLITSERATQVLSGIAPTT